MTEKQSNTTGMIKVVGEAMNAHSVIRIADVEANLRIQISDILVKNLDSVGDPLHVLQPVDQQANVLHNMLSFGVDSKPMKFKGNVMLSLDVGADMKIRNEIDLSFILEDFTLQA